MRYDVCESFWCVEMDCASYNTGDGCKTCEKFRTCENCVLQSSDNKSHGCEEEGYYLLHGYPEEGER